MIIHKLKLKIFFVLVLINVNLSRAQLTESYLSIESNIEGAKVYLDSMNIGETPIYNFKINSGNYNLKVVYPDDKSWNQSLYTESIQLSPGENLKKYIELEYIFIINSTPIDANVFVGDSLIGQTPVVYFTKSTELVARIEKEDYESVIFKLDKNNHYKEAILLKKESKVLNKSNLKVTHLSTEVYIAGGSAIIFGSAAALLKVKADEHYKKYRSTGDRSELTQVRKFDKLSGISLFLCEISNILLVYLLLLR